MRQVKIRLTPSSMNKKFPFKLIGYVSPFILLACMVAFQSCRDTASTGFLCNYTGASIRYVMQPIDTALYSQNIKAGRVRVIEYSTSSGRAVLDVNNDVCLWIANGINGLDARSLFIDYLEIQKEQFTEFYTSREAIFALFKKTEKEVYEIQVVD